MHKLLWLGKTYAKYAAQKSNLPPCLDITLNNRRHDLTSETFVYP